MDCGARVERRRVKRCRACQDARHKLIWRPLEGPTHPSWRGGVKRLAKGYLYQKAPDHPHANCRGYVLQHRLVMEAAIGRYLDPSEVIHHINGVKDDNRIENLKLYANHSEHVRDHNLGVI